MTEKNEYEIQVTFTVLSHTYRWAYIRALTELTKLPDDLFVRFTLPNIPAMGMAEAPEPKKEPVVETRIVWSDTYSDVAYIVQLEDGTPVSCECPDFTHRHANIGGMCKHMKEVRDSSLTTAAG